jgi:hypothetical protein
MGAERRVQIVLSPVAHRFPGDLLSRQEQSAVDSDNERLAQALREGNARYEARFGRVLGKRLSHFFVSGMLQPARQRLQNLFAAAPFGAD